MQIIIEEIVSRIQTVSGGSGLSQDTLRTIVTAVIDTFEQQERHRRNVDEELSLRNYQERNRPWEL